MNPKISVIIPTYNSVDTIVQSIKTILDQTVTPFEILVINNASTDHTDTIVKKKFPEISLFTLRQNTGVTGGRNYGISKSCGDYILFFDHDMDATKTMIEELLKVIKSKKNIGIVTPKIYYYDKKNIIWSAGTDVNLWTGQTIFHGGVDHHQFDRNCEVAVAPAVLLVKKDVIKKIGMFDNVYFATYEDTDFCFRAKKAGFLTFYSSKAIAYHRIPYDDALSMKRLLSRTYWVGRNRVIFMKKFGKNFFVFLFFIPIYIFYYMVLSFKFSNPFATMDFIKGTIIGFLQ